MDNLFKLLDDLIKPGNWPFLLVFILVLVAAAAVLIFLILAFLKKDKLDVSRRFGPLWIHLYGGNDDPRTDKRLYRKLLYVKVTALTNRQTAAAPAYTRVVDRLEEADRNIPVYDEAIYYTLKLYPEKRLLTPEQDQSSGVVDARLVIPWLTQLEFHNEGAGHVRQIVDIETKEPSDTMLSVSHFLNGLQGRNQNFCSYSDEDAESLRLIVDFSSIPNVSEHVAFQRGQMIVDKRPVENDDFKCEPCGTGVYMALARNVKKGTLVRMDFVFKDWPASATNGTTAPCG